MVNQLEKRIEEIEKELKQQMLANRITTPYLLGAINKVLPSIPPPREERHTMLGSCFNYSLLSRQTRRKEYDGHIVDMNPNDSLILVDCEGDTIPYSIATKRLKELGFNKEQKIKICIERDGLNSKVTLKKVEDSPLTTNYK